MNYGFAELDGNSTFDRLREADKPFLYHIQLYHLLFSQRPIAGKDVLEIGSGRGGGGYFAKVYLNAGTYTGIDLSPENVKLSRRRFGGNSIAFRVGDAVDLPIADVAFDVAINVESSHCYTSIEAFFEEVARVLREGGYLLYTDFRRAGGWPHVERALQNAGLLVERSEDITANVLASLRLDNQRKLEMFRQIAQDEAQAKHLFEWGGCVSSAIFARFDARETTYRFYVASKQGRRDDDSR